MLEEIETCPDCETVLVYRDADGSLLKFTAHDAEFCKLGMKVLVKALRDGLTMANERANYAEVRLLRQIRERQNYSDRLEIVAAMLSGRCHGKMVYDGERWDCPECGRWTNQEHKASQSHGVQWKDLGSIKLVRDRLVEFLDGIRR